MKLGVCYYPEHWPETWWADDAKRMRTMGISHVRIAEFSWSRIEPSLGQFEWDWLDRAIGAIHAEGLSIIMCTPTATPPKWLVDTHPDILAIDAKGIPRHFGSRRHYCFSSLTYRAHSQRITQAIAARYGSHAAVVAWQTDNEYGCHDTVLSYSASARRAFRRWLEHRYSTIDALNTAWGTTFWSQTYRHFDEVDPPFATVTEANPSHRLDWQRFASDEVVIFNKEQVEILRSLSPGRPITHNFMGFFTAFNHYDVSQDLDVASWDSYPLGFTQMFFLNSEEKRHWAHVGHPDIPSFHHDLYRGMCVGKNRNRWWVMEQQPGPVNWADWNPAPKDGMVRLWTWQAFAHGAELVSYFRWRQVPFAQEQMHAGLLRPDRSDDQGAIEASQVGQELATLMESVTLDRLQVNSKVALIFDYDALWMTQIQPQGADYNGLELCFRVYSALKQLGLDVDIVSPRAEIHVYQLIVLPTMPFIPTELAEKLKTSSATIVFGPRTGSKTHDLQIPQQFPPGNLQQIAGVKVMRVESLPPGVGVDITFGDATMSASRWREFIECDTATAVATFTDAQAAITMNKNICYVATWLADIDWSRLFEYLCVSAGIKTTKLPVALRISTIGNLQFAFNFGDTTVTWSPAADSVLLLGSAIIPPQGVAIWRIERVH